MQNIADFSDSELWIVETTLRERYGKKIDLALGESEVRLHSSDRELTTCPVVYWEVGKCHFVIFKTGDKRYRCQFYYRVHQQYGTGINEFDDLTDCTVTLLQTQADYERDQNIKNSESDNG